MWIAANAMIKGKSVDLKASLDNKNGTKMFQLKKVEIKKCI